MNPHWLILAFAGLAQFFLFVRWLHRRVRDDEMQRAFVRDMATSHLPYLYHALRLIAAQMNVEPGDPPPVHFFEINGLNRRRR